MSNQIFLSAESIHKYFDRFGIEETVELPVIGKVVISAKEICFQSDRLSLPIHHKIMLVPDFEIAFEKFECNGTKLSFEIGRVGIIPGFGIELLCEALAGIINKKLGGSRVKLEGNRLFVELTDILSDKLHDIRITELKIIAGNEAGIRFGFEF